MCKPMSKYEVFHLMAGLADKQRVECILIGGFAVNFHKYTRMTTDVDFLIAKDDFQKIEDALDKAGYKNHSIHENFAQFKDDQGALMNVDFMFVDRQTMEKIRKEGHPIKIVGEEFIIPSLRHLIALKLHALKSSKGRLTTDMVDIINLIEVNQIDVKSKEFEDMCLKFGTADIYQKIREAF